MATDDDNNGLYFLVGGLVVLAVIGFFVFSNGDDVENISPAAGEATYTGSAEPGTPDRSSSTELRVDDDGVSSTTTETERPQP
jgi:hypothetical protein